MHTDTLTEISIYVLKNSTYMEQITLRGQVGRYVAQMSPPHLKYTLYNNTTKYIPVQMLNQSFVVMQE